MTEIKDDINRPRILIVDDEEALRRAISFDFKRAGFEVFEAENGELAFQFLKKHSVDLVLTDVRMPVCDGVELLDRIKAIHPQLPVVMFITGFTDLSPEDAYAKGAAAIFAKPFDRKQLMAVAKSGVVTLREKWSALPSSTSTSTSTQQNEVQEIIIDSIIEAENRHDLRFGQGGFFVAGSLASPCEEGSQIMFRIRLSSDSSAIIEGTGIVRWSRYDSQETDRPKGMGIEFSHLTPESIQWMERQVLKSHSPIYIPKN